jgi:hypothetical protein
LAGLISNQNEANFLFEISLQYEYFVSISALRLTTTNSLCTPPVLERQGRLRVDQKREKLSFLSSFLV